MLELGEQDKEYDQWQQYAMYRQIMYTNHRSPHLGRDPIPAELLEVWLAPLKLISLEVVGAIIL